VSVVENRSQKPAVLFPGPEFVRTATGPASETTGVVGFGAHRAGPRVEQMPGPRGDAVGEPATRLTRLSPVVRRICRAASTPAAPPPTTATFRLFIAG
jgi:hypothetical protein